MMCLVFILFYFVIAVCIYAYGMAVFEKHRYIDVWYQIASDEDGILIVSIFWIVIFPVRFICLPFVLLYKLLFKIFSKIL